VKEFGFIGCNLNPDPSGGLLKEPPPHRQVVVSALREVMVELDVRPWST